MPLSIRTLIYLPANDRDLIEKALSAAPDLLVLDVGGLSSAEERASARAAIKEITTELRTSKSRIGVRTGRPDSIELSLDLKIAVRSPVNALVIPGVESPGEIRVLDVQVQDLERHAGLAEGSILLLPSLESLPPVLRAGQMVSASPRVSGFILGLDSAGHSGGATPVGQLRRELGAFASITGTPAIDSPFLDVEDEAGLVAAAEEARRLGFTGKAVVHPRQVEPVLRVFRAQA